jgi:hypothetical protein
MYKNLLVEYKGGGYDGCFWEWNYFHFTETGEFCNLISTGYKGVKDETEARALLESDTYHRRDPEILDLTDRKAVISFVDNGNASLMRRLAEKFEIDLYGTCQHCGSVHSVARMYSGDHSGDGGIAISAKNLYCEACFYASQERYAMLKIGPVSLTVGDVANWRGGRAHYNYTLSLDGHTLFTGSDWSPSPMDDPYSIGGLVSLLGWFTIKPGDTDDEYFMKYTDAQLAWANSDLCYELTLIPYDFEAGDGDNWEVDEGTDEWDNPIYTIAWGDE